MTWFSRPFWKFLVAGFLILPAVTACKSQPSQAEMERAIQSYLDKNPQIIQKRVEEALKSKGVAQAQPEPSLEEKIKQAKPVDLNNAPTLGPADAPITIVEFSDFECPFCSRVVPTIKTLLDEYKGKVRVAFRQHPLSFHKNALSAAKASLAAHAQGKFWPMHDALFANQKDLSDQNILKIAKDLKLDVARFQKDWKSTKFDDQIQKDVRDSEALGARGTPAFFINGVYLKGAKPAEAFREVINKILEQQGTKAS